MVPSLVGCQALPHVAATGLLVVRAGSWGGWRWGPGGLGLVPESIHNMIQLLHLEHMLKIFVCHLPDDVI